MKKVSICIPAYKDVYGICRLLNSINKQEFKDFDIIITDDTPDDSIKALVNSFAPNGKLLSEHGEDTDVLLIYEKNNESLGPAGNWNKAISLADGEYVKIMHQDDWFTFPYSLGRYVELLDQNHNAILAFSGSRQVSIHESDVADLSDFYDRHISATNLELLQNDIRNLYLGGFIGAPSATIFRNHSCEFDDKLQWLIDSDFYMSLVLNSEKEINHSLEPLVSIGVSSSQLTNSCATNKDINIFEYSYLFEKYHLENEKKYRERLINIVLEYKGHFSDVRHLGISKKEYNLEKKKHVRTLGEFYVQLIRKKLHL